MYIIFKFLLHRKYFFVSDPLQIDLEYLRTLYGDAYLM